MHAMHIVWRFRCADDENGPRIGLHQSTQKETRDADLYDRTRSRDDGLRCFNGNSSGRIALRRAFTMRLSGP